MRKHAAPMLDDLDRRILNQLQTDSSLTNQALAEKVHASAPTCLRRVRRLTELGIIERQIAILNSEKLGAILTVVCEITLDTQTPEAMNDFETHIIKEQAIAQCYRVSPGPDFVVIAHVANMPAYHALAHRAFTSQRNVRNVRTFFSTHRAKFSARIPVETANETR